ncbi:MAG: NAD-dependent epimerase/dehydratase family protein [Planctomycetota bacterium]|nr:MAG: NAD-dependent epimerase/dehydratase family protein [Planctomycetota bacterium]REJ93397.1 MAG: NAD-dependent epimerase/dehydratase family protein [Planctomycetota bacterium]REK20774.1 MAG: NAD-dependent epimerase/dehydratase family protein [Planctomycetota bacterium]REK38044.1 MAG: NAD-dependent epimerase/dehydratase family protein [Planctomycetota bacterium]
MQAVVTGATGFLGKRLVQSLCREGVSVRCVVRRSSNVGGLRDFLGDDWRKVDVARTELTDFSACVDALSGADVVYHAAAGLTGSTSTLFLNTVIPTRVLMDAALEVEVRRFVLISSLGVYGTASLPSGSVLDESSPVEPEPHLRDPYTYSKVVQEQAAWEAWRERRLPLVVVRPGVIFGLERGVLSGRVGVQVGGRLIAMGGGQTLPYTFVENCADAIALAGMEPGLEGEVFNVIDDDPPTAARLLKMLRRAGRRPRTVRVPGALIGGFSGLYEWYHRYSRGQLPGVITRYRSASMWKKLRFTNEKARRQLRWRPEVAFDEAFRRSLQGPDGRQ